MRIRIRFLLSFQELFDGKVHEKDLPRTQTLGKLLRQMADTEEKRRALFDGENINPFAVVVRNGLSVRSKKDLSVNLREGDTISVFPLMGGG